MAENSMHRAAGLALRYYIKQNYKSQEAFAEDFCADLRTINRYINEGIKKNSTIEEIAVFFGVDWFDFLMVGKQLLEQDSDI